MSIKKYTNGSFVDIGYKRYETSTDTLTTLPADIIADGQSATVGLQGNMSQTGTPTPQNPIEPSECGERTGNLFDRTGENVDYYVDSNGNLVGGISAAGWTASDYIEIEENTQYTFNPNTTAGNSAKHCFYNAQKQPFASYVINSGQQTFTTPSGAKYARFSYRDSSPDIMLNTGSTALPFEPYGFKIPISSANTTTPVYLAEVETTRWIKEFVLTGEETYTYDSSYSRFITILPNAKIEGLRLTQVYCTHFISVYDGRPISEVPNNSIYSSDVSADRFFIKTTDYTSAADFKSYLAQQYANGTPVTVWYVLATPETGIVNEPIRKIGDYADAVSGVTVPTTGTAEQFDVLTSLKPSEVSLTYTGWHPKSDTKF